MRQAIITHYLGPTLHRGPRVRAQADAGSLTTEWDPAHNSERNHARAAHMLCERLGWDSSHFVGGGVSGSDYVWVDTWGGWTARTLGAPTPEQKVGQDE